MRAVRLRSPGGPDELVVEDVATPRLGSGEAIVRVHAAAITRDELEWPVERLPAIPAYEMSGVVADIAPDVDATLTGQPVYALTQFDRDGAAAEFVAVPAKLLAPKPGSLDHVQAAAVPLAALSAWQGLFDHGRLQAGQRVLIHGAAGGVGQFATQLGRWAGAHVIGTTSGASTERAKRLGAHEVIEYDRFDVEVAGDRETRREAPVGRRRTSIATRRGDDYEQLLRGRAEPGPTRRDRAARRRRRRAPRGRLGLSACRGAGRVRTQLVRGKRGKVVLRVVDD
jgi:NADPH:quinone reductase-like Zn-dependent oxidoreductase